MTPPPRPDPADAGTFGSDPLGEDTLGGDPPILGTAKTDEEKA